MNDYPVWWDKTITVYNKLVDAQTQVVTWQRTVLENCFWKVTTATTNRGSKLENAQNNAYTVLCRIQYNDKFVSATDWLSLESTAELFTLQVGDIIVLGETDFEINEYGKGQRSTDLLNKYHSLQQCFTIVTTTIDTMTGMLEPYYYVMGA